MVHVSRLVFGRYKLESRLGGGGMGEVFLATDLQTCDKVVVKISKTRIGGSEKDQQRVLAEASLLSRFDHPGINRIYDCGIDQEEYFYVMEYVEGTSLLNTKNLPLPVKIEIFRDCADIMNHIHSRGVVHRDIKPENVVVLPEKSSVSGTRAKIIDFGLAYFSGKQRITESGHVVGTLNYMAPELLLGIDFDYRADLYSFGVTMYYTLTGRLPIESRQTSNIAYSILNTMPEPPSKYNSEITSELDQVVLSLLRRDPRERIQTAKELSNLLSDMCENSKKAQPNPSSVSVTIPMLFGRENEMDELFEHYNQSTDSSCAVLLSGPFGIGKSRLAEEFAIKAQFQGAVVLRAHGISSATPEPLYGLRQLFWNLQHYPFFETIQKKTSDFIALASMNVSMMLKYKIKAKNFRFTVQERLDSFSGIVATMCKAGQVMVVLDDCDLIDKETLDLCASMVVENPRNFFLLMTSDESRLKLENTLAGDLLSEIDLEPIRDIAGFASSSLGIEVTGTEMIENLSQNSMGVPNLLLDQLRSYVATGCLKLEDGKLRFDPSKSKSIKTHDFIASILDTISENGRRLLSFAGVMGHRFIAEMASKVLGLESRDAVTAIDELVRLGVLTSVNEAGSVFYNLQKRFMTNVWSLVSAEDARHFNKLIAVYLESDPNAKPEWIFNHYSKANHAEKSVQWAVKICESFSEKNDFAINRYIEHIETMAQIECRLDWLLEARIFQAKQMFNAGKHHEALDLIDDTINQALEKGFSSILLDCFLEKASMLSKLRQFSEAIEVGHGSIHLAKITARTDAEYLIHDSLSKLYLQTMDMEQALVYARSANDIARNLDHATQLNALNSLVTRLVENHKLAEAEKLMIDALEDASLQNIDKVVLKSSLARIVWLKGEIEQASNMTLEILGNVSPELMKARALRNFAAILHSAGRYQDSFELANIIESMDCEQSEKIAARLRKYEMEFECHGWQNVLTKFDSLIDNARETGRIDIIMDCYTIFGNIACIIPNLDNARNAFEKSWEITTNSKLPYLICNTGFSIMTAFNQPFPKSDLKKIAEAISELPEIQNDTMYELLRLASLGMISIIEGKTPIQIKKGIEQLTCAKTMAIASGHRQRMAHLTKLLGKVYAGEFRFSRSEIDRKLAEQNFFESEFIYRSIGANWLADYVSGYAEKYLH